MFIFNVYYILFIILIASIYLYFSKYYKNELHLFYTNTLDFYNEINETLILMYYDAE